MKWGSMKWLALGAVLAASPVLAQEMPDIGFKSVGRGRPLAASVYDFKDVGPNWIREFGQRYDPAHPFPLNGYAGRSAEELQAVAARRLHEPGLLRRQSALDRSALLPLQQPAGDRVSTRHLAPPPLNTSAKDEDAPWGHCEISYPREAIVSPYGFKTAQEHYEALLKETQGRGGPNVYTYANFPAVEWNGVYERPARARAYQNELVLGAAHPDLDDRVAAEARVPAAHGAGGLSPDARQRAVAVDVLLARGFHAALVHGGRLGALRDRDARSRARAGRRRAQLPPGHLRRAQIQHGGRARRAAFRASARRCRVGTARRSASGTRTC